MAKQTELSKIRNQQPISLPQISPMIAIGILGILVMIFYSPFIFGGKFLWEDFVEQEFPFRNLATTSLASGHIPQWNPYVFSGMPFIADIQVAFWYPINMIQSLFVSDGHLSPIVTQWFIILHYLVAAAGMFFLVKHIFKTDEWSALFAGIVYAFSGYLTAQPMHQMIVYQLALFPFVVLFFLKGTDSWRDSIVAGLLLGIMYLAGHPQTSLYLTFFLGVLAVYEIVYRIRNKSSEQFSSSHFLRMAIPLAIAIGLFAIQLLPSQELAALSRRDVITFEKSVEGSLTFGHIATLILPRLFGVTDALRQAKVQYWNGPYYLSWETMCYIGVLPLLLGISAAFAGKKKYAALFAGMSLFALLFALGDHFFLYKIFFQFPLFNKLRTPSRMMMVFTFAMSGLAGLGLSQAIIKELSARAKKMLLGATVITAIIWIAALAGMLTPKSFLAGAPDEAIASISWAAGLAAFPVICALILAFLISRKMIGNAIVAVCIIGVTLIELFSYGMGINASTEDPRTAYEEQSDLVKRIKDDQTAELSRARIRSAHAMLLKRNQGAYDRIQLLEGYNPLVLARSSPETSNTEITADLLNIKWSVKEEARSANFVMRPTYLPRVKMYYKTSVHPDEEAKRILRTDSTFDYRNTILLEESPSQTISAVDSLSIAKIIRYEDNEIGAKVSTKENGILFFSEVYYPAWHAYIDGKETKLFRAFTSLRAVEVPKGEHSIVLKYESDAFQTGSMVTLITLGMTIAGIGFFSLRKTKA
ncbi:MAG: YfhO family protein [bacterium]